MKKQVRIYTLAILMQGIGSGAVMLYMNVFMTDYLLIDAALVATALLVAKFIDLFVSFITGPIVEKANFKNGTYGPWFTILKYGLFACFVLTYLDTYTLGIPELLRASLVVLAYVGYGGGMSILMIARGGLLQQMAGADMDVRNVISARTAQATAAAQIITSAIAVPMITFFAAYVGENHSYAVTIGILAILMVAGCLLMRSQAKIYDVHIPAEKRKAAPKVSLKDMFQSVAGNSQMMVLIVCMSVFYIAMQTFLAIQAYYFRNIMNDFNFMAVSMTIKTVFAFVASLFMPALGKKVGKKNAFILGLLLYAAALLGITFLGASSEYVFTFFTCVFTAAMYLFTSFGVNYFLDCGEYGYYKTGKDNRATAMAMYNIPMKIGFMGGSAIGSYGLAMIGYQVGMEITEGFVHSFMFIIGGIPAALCILGAVIFFFAYRLKDEDVAMYARENAARDKAVI